MIETSLFLAVYELVEMSKEGADEFVHLKIKEEGSGFGEGEDGG